MQSCAQITLFSCVNKACCAIVKFHNAVMADVHQKVLQCSNLIEIVEIEAFKLIIRNVEETERRQIL